MSNRNAQGRLQDALDALPREVLPRRDLWRGIEHALLEPERVSVPWYRHTALAASVLVVLALSLYFGALQPTQPLPNSDIERLVNSLRGEHELNKRLLLVQYQDQQPYYAGWEQELLDLEEAEAAIFEALRDDPENREWIEILRQVQEKQLNLIDKVFDHRPGTI